MSLKDIQGQTWGENQQVGGGAAWEEWEIVSEEGLVAQRWSGVV